MFKNQNENCHPSVDNTNEQPVPEIPDFKAVLRAF